MLIDRTHHADRERFYWLPGRRPRAGRDGRAGLKRELIEEAALEIEVG